MIVELMLGVLANAIYDSGKFGLKKFFDAPPARKAISATAKEFESIPLVADALTRWCQSDEFVSQLESVQTQGVQSAQTEEDLVDSFVRIGLFHDGLNNTHASARRVLEAYAKNLESALYRSEDGLLIEGHRAQSRHQESQEGIRGIKDQLQEMMSVQLAALDPATSPLVQEKLHFERVDLANELLKDGKPRSAFSILEKLRGRVLSENPSADLLFRIAANLGTCAIQLDDFKTARAEFTTALSLKPDHRKVLSNASIAWLFDGDKERALDFARRSRPSGERDPSITSTYIRVLHYAGQSGELESLLEDEGWVKDDPMCAFSLGLIKLERGEHAEAEMYLRTAVSGDEENPHAHRLLAQAIILPVDEEMLLNPPLTWRISPQNRTRIDEADTHLTRAVEIIESHENRERLHEALIQRAYVRSIAGPSQGTLEDCDRILANDPSNAEALKVKGQTLLFSGHTDDALACFTRIQGEEDRQAAVIGIALAYGRSGEPTKVIELLDRHWNPAEHSRQQVVVADLLLSAYHRLGDTGQVEVVMDALAREGAEDPESLVVRARQLARTGQQSDARGLYEESIKRATPGNQRERIGIELADFYFSIKEWSLAADFYGEFADQDKDSESSRKYLLSLFYSGANPIALELAQKLRGGSSALPTVSEVEARLLVAAEDIESARELFSQLAQLEPEKISHQLWVVNLDHQLGNYESARAKLDAIPFEKIKNDPELLMQVAQLRQLVGLDDELRFAYRARRIDFSNLDVHEAYLELFINSSSRTDVKLDLDVFQITVDHAVHVVDESGEKKLFLIVDQEELDPLRGELAPMDSRAVKLLGLRTGDRVTFSEGEVGSTTYTITDVQHKYVYAFQQTIREYNAWFAEKMKRMAVLKVGSGGDFSQLFEMLDRRRKRGQGVMGLYRKHQLPLATLAQLLNRGVFEIWAGLVDGTDVRLYMTSGELSKIDGAIRMLSQADEVVVDITALLTLTYLDRLEDFARAFRRIVVARASVDELNSWIAEVERSSAHTVGWKEEDQHVHQEVTAEMVARRRQFLEKISSFIERHTDILAPTGNADLPDEQSKRYRELLGGGTFSSILLAGELKVPLYADDMGLSQIAAGNEFQVGSVWTQITLMRMKSRGLLSAVDYYEALRKLILGNYVFLSLDATAMWWMCKFDGKKPTPEINRVLHAMLQGPASELKSASRLAADFIYRVWLEVSDEADRFQLIDLVTDSLFTGRDKEQVRPLLKAAIESRFSSYHRPITVIFARIEAYVKPQSITNEQE